MARTRTLTLLMADVRKAANIEGHTGPFPDDEITEYINAGIAHYNNLAKKARGGELLKTKSTRTTTSGTMGYAFSSFSPSMAMLATIAQVYATADGRTYELHPISPEERPHYEDTNAGWTGLPHGFDRRESTLDILPTPGGAYTITVWWVPAATRLVNGSDTFDGVDGWEGLVINWAASEACDKAGHVALAASRLAKYQMYVDEVQSALASLNMSGPPRVGDSRGTRRYSPFARVGRR